MDSQERITYQAFVVREFLSQVLKVAVSSLAEEQFGKLKQYLNILLQNEDDVFHQVEKLAQIPDTTEITIFFSDLLERLDYDDPYDVVDSFENVIGDFITLNELLLEEPENVAAIDQYITDAGVIEQVAQDEIQEQELVDESLEKDKATEEETEGQFAADELVEEAQPEEKEEVIEVEEEAPLEDKEVVEEKTKEVDIPQDPVGFIEFIFAELLRIVAIDKNIKKKKQLADASKQYILQLRDNFKRKPELLLNQPKEKARDIAQLLIDNLQEPKPELYDNYLPFVEKVANKIISYASENEEDLVKSFTGVLSELSKTAKEKDKETKDRKVLQQKVYSYFEKETEFHIDQLHIAVEKQNFDSFWVELEALKTLVMIHGYEAIETACLRLHKEKEQWEAEEVESFLSANAHEISQNLRGILQAEIEKEHENSQELLDKLDDLIYSGFAIFEDRSIDDEIAPELEKIWLGRFADRKIEELPDWTNIDYDNALLLGFPEGFLDGLNVIKSFLEGNPFLVVNWEDYFEDWPSIFKNKDVDLLSEKVNHCIDRSTGAILSLEQQELISQEIFKQICKRFADLAPFYQLTDDEQAYFQQQITELSQFILDDNYQKYVQLLLAHLNEYFYEEFSDTFVKKYLDRISKPYEKLEFPLDDLKLPSEEPDPGKKVEASGTEAGDDQWIDEVESAVSLESNEEYLSIFQTETTDYLQQIEKKLSQLVSGNKDVIGDLESFIHSISSSAGMVGLNNTSSLASMLENALVEMVDLDNEMLQNIPEQKIMDILEEFGKIVSDPAQDANLDANTVFKEFAEWLDSSRSKGKSEEAAAPAEEITADPEMLEVFRSEAGQNVDTIITNLNSLKEAGDNLQAVNDIITPSHDIMSAAKMLGFAYIGDLMMKIEAFAESTVTEEGSISSYQAQYLLALLSDITEVMDGKQNDHNLAPAINEFELKISAGQDGEISFNDYVDKYLDVEISSFIDKHKSEGLSRAFISAVVENIQDNKAKKRYANLLDLPLKDWKSEAVFVKETKGATLSPGASVPVQKSDILLDSSAALVDSQLEMQDQLNRNRELLTELNSTQNLLNYLKAELDELDQKSETGPAVKKRRAELSRILNDAVAKMNHLVQEMGRANTAFESRLTNFDNLSDKFQRNILEARKMPASELLKRLQGLVDILKDSTGKEFDLKFSGEQIELDISTVDFLEKPLKELLINAVYHGMESKEERSKAGKDDTGHIAISLSKKRNLIQLEFRDDGKGLNLTEIGERAKQLKIDNGDDETQLVDLLFQEKFSMSDERNEYIGDGSGLFELRKAVETIRGDINIDSETGVYTSISLVFPQHIKITDAAIVQAEKDYFAIPLGLDDETVRLKKKDIQEHGEKLWVQYKGKKYPAFHFNESVNLQTKSLAGNNLSAIRFVDGDLNLFMIVDHIREIETIVIRPLQKEVESLSFIAGVAQLPNFQTVLVLETDALLNKVDYDPTGADTKVKDTHTQKGSTSNVEISHGVVFSFSQYSADIIADVLREHDIETEVITDAMEWTEDLDQADILFADAEAYNELKKSKGLWLNSPDMIIILHDGEIQDLPSGANALLARPFNEDDILGIISG